MPFVPTFGSRFHDMVSAGHDCVGWSEDGRTVWVSNPERLARSVIPSYFGHASYASLTRSLHAHSFNKISATDWTHPAFLRDDPDLSKTITRKRPRVIKDPAAAPDDPMDIDLLPPLRAVPIGGDAGEASDSSCSSTPSRVLPCLVLVKTAETPSPAVKARLAALAEQVRSYVA